MAISKISIMLVVSMIAIVSAYPGGKGEHVHFKIHVPYLTHDHHHHHVQKVGYPVVKHVPVYKTVHVPVPVPVKVHHHEPKHEEVHVVEEHHSGGGHDGGFSGVSDFSSGSSGWQGSHGGFASSGSFGGYESSGSHGSFGSSGSHGGFESSESHGWDK
uniref:Uncharacterized protein n=1 Tax=Phlebotomus papatasi TaxID=29031 RepID=A0A1B0D709_PHLPP